MDNRNEEISHLFSSVPSCLALQMLLANYCTCQQKQILYLFPDKHFGYGPNKSRLNFANAYSGISVSLIGGFTFWADLVWQIWPLSSWYCFTTNCLSCKRNVGLSSGSDKKYTMPFLMRSLHLIVLDGSSCAKTVLSSRISLSFDCFCTIWTWFVQVTSCLNTSYMRIYIRRVFFMPDTFADAEPEVCFVLYETEPFSDLLLLLFLSVTADCLVLLCFGVSFFFETGEVRVAAIAK